MATIREQLAEQARAIEAGWANSGTMLPRESSITLNLGVVYVPMAAIRNYRGRVNSSEVCGTPPGHLLLRGGKTVTTPPGMGGPALPVDVTIVLAYREIPWNHVVLVSTATTLGARPKILVDAAGLPAYQSFDLDALLDALQPPDGKPAGPANDPSPGSWRDRPSLL